MSDSLLIQDRGSVRTLLFNRPDVHNAQNVDMLETLDRALVQVACDENIRVLVLGGVGPSFCSGHDLREMAMNRTYAARSATVEGRYRQELQLFVDPVMRFRSLSIPTICKVQGHCLAAALMFVAASDLVVAADDARFGSPILRHLGVNDAEVFTFAQRLGERRAKQLIWLDDGLNAEEALRHGVVNWVVAREDLDVKTAEIADRLADTPHHALALSKATFQFAAERKGEADVNAFHFLAHQISHHTVEARKILDDRLERVHGNESPIPAAQPRGG